MLLGGRTGGERMRSCCLNRVSVWQDGSGLELCCSSGLRLTLQNCALGNGEDGKFYVVCVL